MTVIVVEQLAAGVLRDISITVATGEALVFLGPPASGKTTLLRALAGFEAVKLGRVIVDGEPITLLPPGSRPTAFVATEDSTFPHLTVFDNVALGLRLRREPESLVERVGLAPVAAHPASQLTDEGRWRVALARAVAVEPKVLLVDDPVGDAAVGLALARSLAARFEASVLAATRDRTAALATGDRVAFLRAGRLEQVDAPVELFYRPATPYVADYVARANLLECIVDGIGAGVVLVRVFDRRIAIPADQRAAGAYELGDRALLVVRPEALRLVHDGEGIPGIVRHAAFLGATVAYEVEVEGQALSVVAPDLRGRLYPVGAPARVGLIQEALSLLPYPNVA
jgi:iron(III) transport system ATP-binding protein